MFRHRLAPEADYYRLPEPPPPVVRPGSFLLWSVALIPGCPSSPAMATPWLGGLQQVYVHAFEQAQAAARPALPERDLFAFWN